jgi:hypothetical protein
VGKLGKQMQERKKNWLGNLQRIPSERAQEQILVLPTDRKM